MSMREVKIDAGYIKKDYEDSGYTYEIRHLGNWATERHGLCKWRWDDGYVHHTEYFKGKAHGINIAWDAFGKTIFKKYYLYDEEVSEEEYRKHQLVEELSGI